MIRFYISDASSWEASLYFTLMNENYKTIKTQLPFATASSVIPNEKTLKTTVITHELKKPRWILIHRGLFFLNLKQKLFNNLN